MRNNADVLARSPRGGKGSFFPSSFRTISSYLRSVSANAGSIAASTVRQAAVSAASNGVLNEDDRQREQVQWANFDKLELGTGEIRQVLLLTYLNGFQVWDVEEASNVHELVSRRDGPVAFLRLQPKPIVQEPPDGRGGFKEVRPLLLVLTGDTTGSGSPSPGGFSGGHSGGATGSALGVGASNLVPTVVRFYSLQNHSYVHVLRFRTGIYAVRCSPRVVAVALVAQIYCFDAATLLFSFSVLTYPSPAPAPGTSHVGYGAMALGPRWLAYAANQPLMATTGRISPQHLTPSPGVSPSTSPANGSLVAHYAKESSKHLVAGVVTLGDMGYKTISRYCSELMPDGGTGSLGTGNPSWKNGSNGHTTWQGGPPLESEYAGAVIVQDFVSKTIVAQFRAHSSPLSALAFDPSGTILVTASVYGHNLNVFRLTPPSTTSANTTTLDASTSFAHLYKLYRGVTNAVIQDISFSGDSQWIAVSSSRGTNHLFAISPFGGVVGPQTHGTVPVDGLIGPTLTPAPTFPWWSSTGPVRVNQQALPPPPPAINLNVVSRIKNGNTGWRGTVTTAAVAATGRSNALAGAVAAVFHAGGATGVESEIETVTFKDQLWILCPTGHLLRYVLRPTAGEGGNSSGVAGMAGGSPPVSSGLPQELKVVVEPLEKWDVCRRPNWVEREERIESQGALREEAGYGGEAKSATMLSQGGSRGVLGREGMGIEEMQRWFMSNAEVQMYQAKPLPVWAKAKIYFHVMLSGVPKEADGDDGSHGDSVAEIEIERIPTRVVEIHRKDLVPVIKRLQNLTQVQGARDINVPEALPGLSGVHEQLHADEDLQNGLTSGGLGGVQIKRTSSCSSLGSEHAPSTMNGFHHAYQESPDVAMTSTYASSFEASSHSHFHQVRQGLDLSMCRPGSSQETLSSPKDGTAEFFQVSFGSQAGNSGGIASGSPPLYISMPQQRDVGMVQGYAKPDLTAGYNNPGRLTNRGRDGNHDMPKGLKRNGSGPLSSEVSFDGNHYVPQIPVSIGHAESMVVVNQAFGDLGVQGTGGTEHMDPGVVRNIKAPWDMRSTAIVSGVQSVENGALPLRLQPDDSPTSNSNTNQEFERAFLYNPDGHQGSSGIVSEGTLDRSPRNEDLSGATDDAESVDAHSKSEDNEGIEQGDDVWEGAMFPFCEDDG